MTAIATGQKVDWYRIPIGRENLSALNQRSDLKGFAQTFGHLGVLACTGSAAVWAVYHWPWYAALPIFYIHGMCWAFLINGFHELVHDSVFKTRWLNALFLRVFSFLGQYNHIHFWASHTEHHKFTLHPPDDLEETLPRSHYLWPFIYSTTINPRGAYYHYKGLIKLARGQISGQWTEHLFEGRPDVKQKAVNWARIVLIGHGLIVAVSLYMHWWFVPVVITLAPFYGGALHYLCNSSQHVGLQDNVSDFRLCCRTIYLNPFVQFLYWHMNYHTEHHMYAGVPCYNLPKLHRLIKDDMPKCPNGLVETWRLIIATQKRQKIEPEYRYVPEVPPMRSAKKAAVATPAEPDAAEFSMAAKESL